jgi:protein-disulfide isomerase
MRRLVLVLGFALASCTSRTPPAQNAPVALAEPESGELKLPQNEHRPRAEPSDVERIYEIAETPGAPMLGAADAKVKLEICSDFQCPYCKELAPTVHELNENYGELLRIVWRNCPLPFHEHALPAAEAAVEVLEQRGSKAFWAYHDQLFAHQGELGSGALVELAAAVEGVDPERVRSALTDHRHEKHVRSELMALVDSGATSNGLGTPAVFINGRMIAGAQPYRVFEDAVERALQELPTERKRAVSASQEAYPMARVRHILVQYEGAKNARAGLKRSKEEAAQRVSSLQQRLLKEPADFAAVAREASDCPSAKQDGELGRFTVGELEPSFELALFGLSPGQISEVVETPFGYHLLLREE